jgi:hypothetical protein
MKKIVLLGAVFLLSSQAYAFNARKCAQKVWLKMGWWRTYDVKYTSIEFISLRTSTQEGTTKTTSRGSTQDTTMLTDPGITTGTLISTSQFSSSYGECALWAANLKWLKREKYIAENYNKLKLDSARGAGEYADSLLYLSGCSANVKSDFNKLLKNNFNVLFKDQKEAWSTSSKIDNLVKKNALLARSCRLIQLT